LEVFCFLGRGGACMMFFFFFLGWGGGKGDLQTVRLSE